MGNWAEIAGYLASLFIVLSFVFKGVKTIRIINFIGCGFFVVYGLFVSDAGVLWPIIIPNGILCLVHVYYLFIKKTKEEETKK